jgi:hypothetical protein
MGGEKWLAGIFFAVHPEIAVQTAAGEQPSSGESLP